MARLRPARVVFERLEVRQLLSGSFPNAGATAVAYDASGVLHLAYYDTAQRSLDYATKSPAGVWSQTAVVDAGPNVGSSLALAVDAAGNVGIAYYDAKLADLKYAHLTGSAWDISRVDFAGSVGQNPSLAFDPAGHPVISYFSKSAHGLKVAQFDGARWVKRVVDGRGTAGQFSSVAIDPADGSWAVAYTESGKRQVRFASQSGTKTTIEQLPKVRGWATQLSLAFDAGGAAAFSYYDPTHQDLKLASFAGTWHTQVVVSSDDVGVRSTLSFDPVSGTAQIVYLDRTTGTVDVATPAGGGWATTALGAGSDAAVARDPLTNTLSVLLNNGAASLSLGTTLPDPSNLVATSNGAGIDLTWSDNSTTETGFVIERSGGGSFAPVGQVGADVTSYTDTTAADGASYTYRVKAVDATSSSGWAVSGAAAIPLQPASNLHAVPLSDNTVRLTWSDQSAGESGFRIERSADGVTFAPLATTGPNVVTFDDATVGNDQTWYYRVVDFNANGDGPTPAPVLVHTLPAQPTHLNVTAEGATQFSLTWDPIHGLASHVIVQMRLAGTGDDFRTLATIDPSETEYLVTQNADGIALPPDTAYEFRILTDNAEGYRSDASNVAVGSTGLIAPDNLAVQVLSTTDASLTWEANSGAALHYNVYLSANGSDFTLYSPTYLQASLLTLTALTPGTHYWVKVTAAGSEVESAGTTAQFDTPAGTPGGAPANIAAQVSLDNPLWLDVSWTNTASDAIGFHIQRSTGGVDFTTIDDVPVTSSSYDDPSVVEGTYYYRVVPFGASGDGTPSAVASAAAYLANPIKLGATADTTGTIQLTWADTSALTTGFSLYVADSSDNSKLVDGSISAAATSYTVTHFADGTPLTAGETYWFYLSATGPVPAFETSQWARVVNGFAAPAAVDLVPTDDGQMTIAWTDVAGETGYQLESSTDGVQYSIVATVGPNVTRYVQNGLPEHTQYFYRVKALDGGAGSAYSPATSDSTTPASPTNLVVTPLAGGSFQLSWDDNSSAEYAYAIHFVTRNGYDIIPLQLPGDTTSALVTETDLGGLAIPGDVYTFQVVAVPTFGTPSKAAEVTNVRALADAAA